MAPPDSESRRKRRRKILFWILGCTLGAILCGLLAIYFTVKGAIDHGIDLAVGEKSRALQSERDAAKREGLPLTPEELFREVQKPSPAQNAAPIYRQMIVEDKKNKESEELTEIIRAYRRGDLEDTSKIESFLELKRPTLELALKAAALPTCDFDRNWNDGAAMLMPELAGLKAAARRLSLRARIECSRGQSDAALRDFDAALRIAEHAGREPGIIPALVQNSTRVIVFTDMLPCLCARANETRFVEALFLLAAGSKDVDLRLAIRGELVSYVTTVRSIPRILETYFRPGEANPLKRQLLNDSKVRAAAEGDSIRYFRQAYKVVTEAVGDGPKLLDGLADLEASGLEPDLLLSELSAPGGPVKEITAISLLLADSQRNLLMASASIFRYRIASGKYPVSLSVVDAPGQDPLSNRPYHYKVLTHGFQLWGVGRNRKDDGGVFGKTQDEGDQLVWYEEGKGLIQPPKKP